VQRIYRRPALLAKQAARGWEASVKPVMVSVVVVICAVLSGAVPASASTASWRVQFVPKPPRTSTFLSAVSCPLPGNCTAVGFAVSGGNPSTLAEQWDGSRWAIQPTPNPAGSPQAAFSGVSCASPASCTAVGDYYTVSGYQPLAEYWEGVSWTIQAVPIPAGAQGGELESVSCASAASCTAVGFAAAAGGESLPLAEHWDGSSWTVQTVPLPSLASGGGLSGVSCPTALDCIAVGETGGQTNVLAERWNGTRWTAQTIPRPAGTNMGLAGVSCKAPERCIAVGSETTRTGGGTTTGAVVERANGPTWTLQADAAPAGTVLGGVSCPSNRSCTAVGVNIPAGTPPVPTTPVAEHWDGTSWALQTVPEPNGTFGAELSGVWCLRALNCTAVGDFGRGGARAIPLAEHYS
jgi:hypothetical protein